MGPWLRRIAPRAALVLALGLAPTLVARADWMEPDESYREAQIVLRMAVRDTVGRSDDSARLDSVGVALLKLARLDDAEKVFRRVVALAPDDPLARAGLGKLALFADRPAEAESLLTGIDTSEPTAAADLYAARLRQGKYAAAAEMTPLVNQEGRRDLLERLANDPPYRIVSGPEHATVVFTRGYPVVLVRAKLNGQSVLMAVDTGTADLILDDQAFRRTKAQAVPGQSIVFWTGSRVAVKNAIVQRLDLGGYRIENCPAGVISLGKWSLEVNPQSERVAGVIGLNLLRRFDPTIDFKDYKLELRRRGTGRTPESAERVPFQIWGESELTVFGSLAESRKMALVVQTGVPGCGVGAPIQVFDEIGVKPSLMSKLTKGVGQYLQGRPWAAVVVPSITVGPIARDKMQGWLGALDASELWRHGVRRDALLSHDFFRGERVTIDWTRHELVFED